MLGTSSMDLIKNRGQLLRSEYSKSKQQEVVRLIELVKIKRFVSDPALWWEIDAGDLLDGFNQEQRSAAEKSIQQEVGLTWLLRRVYS
eukprot:15287121-Ditylum_brightwellii.AAC.1